MTASAGRRRGVPGSERLLLGVIPGQASLGAQEAGPPGFVLRRLKCPLQFLSWPIFTLTGNCFLST